MNAEVIVTILCGLAIAVGVAGVIIPILPGSILIGVSLLAWAIWGGAGTLGWVIFAIGMVFVVAGMAASAVLTGRKLMQHGIPNRSVLAGVVVGVVGMFVIPVVGLFVGFALGLLLSEVARTRDLRTAARTSLAALKATGIGILVEFGLACAAASTWVIGVWINAVNG
ncbi:DUF456 domain-containing protein [Arthrobacter sp. TES]|uniref:DUF456 domain-containing protein n=1 Tax=Paenarthrobacter ureafaciens TaxID=37931 RepID=A0AAX3EHF2_PAEUR|nr:MULTISPECIES: DUF456 domain-containing protein [Paenarthrobacter]AMB41923.1 hypothetical protein AUT26_18180 [Arthrobacter sp. ATCC 21022]ERI36092.1 membrane protein [Arthrobacter sp. AK-YN10]NKR13771.1 hypothetical protein [Arthrobacter sp. M5]NKR17987.1 hypothetical protein [Arthrobacter sp. M6]OEH59060.1 hypothetical protein A5N13_20840 [Arthrobacter sp. D4]OEH59100.1 hypothetical protein A5N17_19160 [Arthrobacter sp. D2]QOI61886.1 DUF456 domain-containing protein [Arthrobacter sp. TES